MYKLIEMYIDNNKYIEEVKKILLKALENENITKKELIYKTKLSKSSVDRIIASLKEKNIIKRIGTNKNSHWKIIK
ncbi:MAG: hypothetical protein IJ809_04750 [Clostridia bacterium]|nr:hypothetical protein [Clostridia bacterium]